MEVGSVTLKNIVDSSSILKPNYHLNYGKKRINTLIRNGKKCYSLAEITKDIYTGGIFKRVFVEKEKYGYPYISAQHMMNTNPIEIAKLISKKNTPRLEDMTLKEKQILVSCAGTVGNTRLIGADMVGVVGSQDIIRVLSNDKKVPYGFIYAYLASPTAFNYIQSFIYGSVVPRIEPNTLGKLPVPDFSKSTITKVNSMIIEANDLRVKANLLLESSIKYFDDLKIEYKYGERIIKAISIKSISKGYKRFDASYSIVSDLVLKKIRSSRIEYVTIKSQAKGIFIGPRSKRNYIESGVPFLSTSLMQKFNPTRTDKFIGKKSADGFLIDKDWILTTRSGTLGETIITVPSMKNIAVSEDAIRVVLNDDAIFTVNYLFAFLKSNIGKNSLMSGAYGSVIQHLNEDYIGDIKVPLMTKREIEKIEDSIENYKLCFDKAIKLENKAIALIENEIESWQK